jgi:hypothetical protein
MPAEASPPSSKCENQRHAVDADHEVVRRIRPDRHEGPGPQRDLAAIADQQIDPERCQRQDQEGDQDGPEQVFVGQQRNADKGEGNHAEDEPLCPGQW